MSSLAIDRLPKRSFSLQSVLDRAMSMEGSSLRSLYLDIKGQADSSIALGGSLEEARKSLKEIYLEASENNWDGCGALRITEEVYFEALRFIEAIHTSMPQFLPRVEIDPDSRGEVIFGWYEGKRQVFDIWLKGNSELVYAGLYGTNILHGKEYFGDSLSENLVDDIKRVYGNE